MGVLPRVVDRHVHARTKQQARTNVTILPSFFTCLRFLPFFYIIRLVEPGRLASTASLRGDRIDKQLVNAKVLMR